MKITIDTDLKKIDVESKNECEQVIKTLEDMNIDTRGYTINVTIL